MFVKHSSAFEAGSGSENYFGLLQNNKDPSIEQYFRNKFSLYNFNRNAKILSETIGMLTFPSVYHIGASEWLLYSFVYQVWNTYLHPVHPEIQLFCQIFDKIQKFPLKLYIKKYKKTLKS